MKTRISDSAKDKDTLFISEIADNWAKEAGGDATSLKCFLVEAAIAGQFDLPAPRELGEALPKEFILHDGFYHFYSLRGASGETFSRREVSNLFFIGYINFKNAVEASGIQIADALDYSIERLQGFCDFSLKPYSEYDLAMKEFLGPNFPYGKFRYAVQISLADQIRIERKGFLNWLTLWSADPNYEHFPLVDSHRILSAPRFWLREHEAAVELDWGKNIPGHQPLDKGLSLGDARKRLTAFSLWGRIERLSQHQNSDRHKKLQDTASQFLLSNLGSGALIGKGHQKNSSGKIKETYIPKSYWRFLDIDYQLSIAKSDLVTYHGVIVYPEGNWHKTWNRFHEVGDFLADKGVHLGSFVRWLVSFGRMLKFW